jgi:hypothetical protein
MKDNSNRVVSLVLLGWFCVAVGLGSWFHDATAPAVAATVWMLTALVLLACWKIESIRVWAVNIDLRWLVLVHGTRLFAGAYFLTLCQRGQMPCAFARPAGWGDIAVAVLALAVVGAMRTQFARALLLSWNTIGFVDIIFVVLSALRFGLNDWQSMHTLRELPLSLLPTFLVPLIITSHILIFIRLARAGAVRIKH